jgi:conjugation system TraG family ATPase
MEKPAIISESKTLTIMYRLTEMDIPILEVGQKGILAKNGDFTVCLELTKPPLFSLSAPQIEHNHEAWTKAIRVLLPGTILHIQDRYTEPKAHEDTCGDGDYLDFQPYTEEVKNGRKKLTHKCYCFITRRNPNRKPVFSSASSLISGTFLPDYVLNRQALQPFLDSCEQFQAILADNPLHVIRRLTAEDLLGEMGKQGIIEDYCLMLGSDDPEYSDIAFEEDIKIHGKAGVVYTLSDAEKLPVNCSPVAKYEPYSTGATSFPIGFATCLGPLLGVEHFYNQYLFIDDPLKMTADLEKRLQRMKSLAGRSRANAVACEAIEKYLQEAAEAQRTLVRAHFNITAWDWDPENIASLKYETATAITRLGALPYLEVGDAPQIWWAGIPGNAGELPINDTFFSFAEQAACFFIPEGLERNSASPFGIRLGERYTGSALHVDISDEPMRLQQMHNRNKFVLGGSGSGKSVFINHLCSQYYEQGAHLLLIDIGGSYRNLCQLLRGQYFALSDDEPMRFNPFQLEKGEMPSTEKEESIKALLLTLWKKRDEPYRRSEYIALSNALHGYYQHLAGNPEIAACFDSFYEYLRDIYAVELARQNVKPEDFDLDNFRYVLMPYYKGGQYDYLLNATDLPDLLEERMIVFELDNIKDHHLLFPIVTIIIMELFMNKMRRLKGVRKVMIIEEAWKAIATDGMGEYVKYIFKTVRKFFGEAVVVTQDIEDIISSPVIKNTIINNSDTKILLDQSKFLHRFDQIQQLLGLTDHDKELVLSLNRNNQPGRRYKEVFIGYANGHSKVYRVELTMEEYLAYTTEEWERMLVEQSAKEHGGLRKGIKELVKAKKFALWRGAASVLLCVLLACLPAGRSSAQVLEVAQIIEAAAKKVIVAADVEVQRLQTQTIDLQDAAKALENSMAGDLLGDITDWVQQEEDLVGAYYQELWQVKTALSSYSKTATLIERQVRLVREEQQDWAAVQRDPHFSAGELTHIANVYNGILAESSRNVQQIELVIKAFVTQMEDAGRLGIIDETSGGIDANYRDLRDFTQENMLLSLQRAKDENDLLTIKALYNL